MYDLEFQIAALIAGHFRGELNISEQKQLDDWLKSSENNRLYFESLLQEGDISVRLNQYQKIDTGPVWEKTMQRVRGYHEAPATVAKFRPLYKIIAAAAAVIFVLGAGTVYYVKYNGDLNLYQDKMALIDIAPGKNTGTLTFSNGRTINLSGTKTGVVINGSKLTYDDGTVLLTTKKQLLDKKIQTITVATPQGGTYQVLLPDGSRIWLNAASSIKFPATFEGLNERRVEITGEVYLEVSKVTLDKSTSAQRIPFLVEANNQRVEVLGTHFNINSYPNETNIRTTLLEGSVRVTSLQRTRRQAKQSHNYTFQNQSEIVLKPGQQSTLIGNDLQVSPADIEQDLAWKNGEFIFNDEKLGSIMRKIERWYKVKVVYETNIQEIQFFGKVSNSKNLSAVLNMMERTGKVHFKLEGNIIKVSK